MRSAGVERTVRFARHLPDFGYRVRVLTTSTFGGRRSGSELRAWEPLRLYRWLRTPARRETPARPDREGGWPGLKSLLRRWVLVPDGQITWLPAASAVGLHHMRQDPPDLIYSTSPPASAHLLGLFLRWQTGVPWVADFRDSWVYDPLDPALLDMPHRRRLERRLEEAVVGGADAVVTTTEVSAGYLASSYPAAADRIRVIANGFEPDEFSDPEIIRPRPEGLVIDDARESEGGLDIGKGANATAGTSPVAGAGEMGIEEPLRIVHTGTFSRSHPHRSPGPLLAAMRSLAAGEPAWEKRLRLVLVGGLSAAEADMVEPLVAAGMVELHGEVDRAGALAFQRGADVLLLVDHPRAWPSSNQPGKLFEYLASGREILALCGVGAAADLLAELRVGVSARPDDVQGIRQALVDLWERKAAGTLRVTVDAKELLPYHRRELTRELASCFDAVVEAGSPGKGPADAS